MSEIGIDPLWAKKLAVIFINEYLPRAKKLHINIDEFLPHPIGAILARQEFDGEITRYELRKKLDLITEYHNKRLNKKDIECQFQ